MTSRLALAVFLGVPAIAAAQTMNGAVIQSRFFNDDPNSNLTVVNNYPTLISFDDQQVDGDGTGGEFANRHQWQFSADGGLTPFQFTNDTFFEAFMDVTLTGSAVGTGGRKEAGFVYTTPIAGAGQFIVNYDAGEIVAFGGPFPFYQFATPTFRYDAGETIRLGIRYVAAATPGGNRRIEYFADGQRSGLIEITNTEKGLIGGNFGGYLQTAIGTPTASNFGHADFANINYSPVPEPATLAALGFGALALLRRRRKA